MEQSGCLLRLYIAVNMVKTGVAERGKHYRKVTNYGDITVSADTYI